MNSADGLVDGVIEASVRRELIVICGAGTSLAATGGDRRAGWSGLIEHALAWCQANAIRFEGRSGLQRAEADLRSGDLLSAADKVQRATSTTSVTTAARGGEPAPRFSSGFN